MMTYSKKIVSEICLGNLKCWFITSFQINATFSINDLCHRPLCRIKCLLQVQTHRNQASKLFFSSHFSHSLSFLSVQSKLYMSKWWTSFSHTYSIYFVCLLAWLTKKVCNVKMALWLYYGLQLRVYELLP